MRDEALAYLDGMKPALDRRANQTQIEVPTLETMNKIHEFFEEQHHHEHHCSCGEDCQCGW